MHDMTALQIAAYTAGYNWNEQHGNKKDWGWTWNYHRLTNAWTQRLMC
jgi:hypothetical protein